MKRLLATRVGRFLTGIVGGGTTFAVAATVDLTAAIVAGFAALLAGLFNKEVAEFFVQTYKDIK
jgi:hypothetical protein